MYMWRYDNITFIYSNDVDGIFGQSGKVDTILTYVKSKFCLMEALRQHVFSSSLGIYTEIDQRTVKYDKPYKA